MTDDARPPHHTDTGFENRYPLPDGKKTFFTFLKRRYFGDENWPKAKHQHGKTPQELPNLEAIHAPDPTQAQITWIGHASALVQYGGINILTDPVFSHRASPLRFAGPRRYSPPGLRIDQLPKIDMVVLSHNHYDHFDLHSLREIGTGPRHIVPLRNGALLQQAGIDTCHELDWDQSLTLDGVTVTLLPSYHWSSRKLSDRKQMLWGGYGFEFADGFKFYFAGDSGWNEKLFSEMGAQYGPFDLGLIPIGAYEPRDFMERAHVNPYEAVQLKQAMGVKQAIAIHWGTFVLTSEPVDEPPQKLRHALHEAGIAADEFQAVPIGATRIFSRDPGP
ncbi:MBL fold metallo-hydrolase [Thalassospira sp.]|uniref:MBL fold metallo-hydrolase n=1 Tax=Thalassospira sp. TaxID=1912094 RepID=UPI0027325BC0|nr:MBL fold metallo-hydrolase [Thalassospira sp.]MDP2698219.1 MBL fold metallo-hydrolase [Thalassospira sp.]